MPNGQPDGIRVVSKSHWSGQGIVFPRFLLPEVQPHLSEVGGCVYVLWGIDEQREALLPDVYVGRTDDVWTRLQSHSKDESKAFWAQTVVFTSTDQSLNLAHIQHIEAELITIASRANKCQLTNDNQPSKPNLAPADTADADRFLFDLMLCLPLCDVGFFVEPEQPTDDTEDLVLREKQILARGYVTAGGFVVRQGSEAVGGDAVESLISSSKQLREELIGKQVLQQLNGKLQMVSDYTFTSPSQAAGVLLASTYNGLNVWKDEKGKSLKQIRDGSLDPIV